MNVTIWTYTSSLCLSLPVPQGKTSCDTGKQLTPKLTKQNTQVTFTLLLRHLLWKPKAFSTLLSLVIKQETCCLSTAHFISASRWFLVRAGSHFTLNPIPATDTLTSQASGFPTLYVLMCTVAFFFFWTEASEGAAVKEMKENYRIRGKLSHDEICLWLTESEHLLLACHSHSKGLGLGS